MHYLPTTLIVLSLVLGSFSLPAFAQSGGADGLPSWAAPSEARSYSQPRSQRSVPQQIPQDGTFSNPGYPEPGMQSPPMTDDRNDVGACSPYWNGFFGDNTEFEQCVDCNWGNDCDTFCQANPNADVCQGYTPPNEVPVDDWLPLLALAGLGLGVYRIQRRREEEMLTNKALGI